MHIKNDKYCFVLNIPSLPDLTHFDDIFMQLNNCLQEKLNITISAGIGNSTDNYSEPGKQYAYICNALNEKFFTGNMSVLTLYNTPYIGVTEYITQVRIENAKEMLKNTHLPIKTVGEKSGFTTYSSFSRVFKKECGMSAKDYRNQFYSG